MNWTTPLIVLVKPARLAFSMALLLCAIALSYQPGPTLARLMQGNDGTVTHSVNGITETWRIDRPNVRQPMTPYPQIRFQPGDQVSVTAGGCVRTGRFGRAWKRYVDPIGPDSGPHFHGMVLIPGAMGRLPASIDSAVRILIAKGGTRTVTAITEPRKQHLWLGYEDDVYVDNNYDSPDEGVQGQCKVGDHLTGSAFVVVTIVHGAPPVQPRPEPFDLLLGALDDNDILLNPKWGAQADLRPNTNASFRGPVGVNPAPTFPDPVGPPCNRTPYSSCTTQRPTSDNGILCGATVGDGHHNWAAATYTGRIFWNDHSCYLCDGDYNFRLVPPGGAGLTTVNGFAGDPKERSMKLEFSDDETIDHFRTPWWTKFHDAVDAVDDANGKLAAARAQAGIPGPSQQLAEASIPGLKAALSAKGAALKDMVRNKEAIVTGLLSLDCAHDCASELHPVWAMAIKVTDDPADETWAIFVRRWGNEGFCSRDQHYLDDLQGDEFVFRLPWKANAASVSPTADTKLLCRFGQAAGPRLVSVPGVGLFVSFFLPVPQSGEGEMLHGELHLRWTGGSRIGTFNRPLNGTFTRTPPPTATSATTASAEADDEEEEDEPESRFAQLIGRMSVDQRRTFTARLPRKTVLFDAAQLRFLAPPQQLTALPARVLRSRRPTVRAVPDAKKKSGDERRLEALRAVFGNNIPEFSKPNKVIRPLRRK